MHTAKHVVVRSFFAFAPIMRDTFDKDKNVAFSIGNETESKSKYGIFGIPWDGGASLGRPGARYAPAKVREALNWILNRIQRGQIAAIERQALIDLQGTYIQDFGDIDIVHHDYRQTFSNIFNQTQELLQKGFIPMAIGGDHSVSFPMIEALHSSSSGNIGIIQFDAHLDLMDESAAQGRFSQSSEIRRALELERVKAKNLVQIGVRGFNFPISWEYVKSNQIRQVTPEYISSSIIDDVAEECLAIVKDGTEKVYMTIDIDVIDPAYAPGCGANEPGGLTVAELEKLVCRFAPHADALDIVEVNPLFDLNDMTSSIAAKLLMNIIVTGALAG